MRTDNEGNYRNSAPCMNCFNVICKLNIKKIIFSSENNEFEIHKTSEYHTDHVSHGNRYLRILMDQTQNTPNVDQTPNVGETPKPPKLRSNMRKTPTIPKCAKPPKQRPNVGETPKPPKLRSNMRKTPKTTPPKSI